MIEAKKVRTNLLSTEVSRFWDTSSNPAEENARQPRRENEEFEKARWKDAKIDNSKDIALRLKCRRVVDQVHSVICFGSENWSWSTEIMDRREGWEPKVMRRQFSFR